MTFKSDVYTMLRSHELKLFTQDSGRDMREGVAWGMEE